MFISQIPTAPDKEVALYFRLRFEQAEQRYDRMKGLVRSALEKVRCIESENKDLRASKELVGLKLQPMHCDTLLSKFLSGPCAPDDAVKSSIEYLVSELAISAAEKAKLLENNRLLRMQRGRVDLGEDPHIKALFENAISEAKDFKPLIAKLQAQITAMEYEWTQAKNMRDELFDYDDKLREHEVIADVLFLKRKTPPDDVKLFATSRRHMIEILVEDRNRNINGYYARKLLPLENLRAKKDAEILDLRMTIRRYELMTGVITAELDEESLAKSVESVTHAESTLSSLVQACSDAEERLSFLQNSVKRHEDHANHWKTAHSSACEMIKKAEKLHVEYDGMMKSLHEEGQRVAAKKRELEKIIASKLNVEDRFTRLRDISSEIDEAEGEIASMDHVLKRLKETKMSKEKAIAAEKNELSLMEVKLMDIRRTRNEHGAVLAQQSIAVESDHVMVDDPLSVGLSHVFV